MCGAGIPACTKLAFNLIYTTSPAVIGEMVTDLSSQAAKAGIKITLQGSNFNYIITNYDNPVPSGKPYINKWAMEDFGGFTDSTYPTQLGVFNGPGALNEGTYSNPTADKLINASVTSGDPTAVKAEASFLTANQPGLFQPNPDIVAVWKKNISGVPALFGTLTSRTSPRSSGTGRARRPGRRHAAPSASTRLPVEARRRIAAAAVYSAEVNQRRACPALGNSITTTRCGRQPPSLSQPPPRTRPAPRAARACPGRAPRTPGTPPGR